jgi:hypothetical protein
MAAVPAVVQVKVMDLPHLRSVVEAVISLNLLHHPIPGDRWAAQRCAACIAGYDPQTGDLCHTAWPCATAEILATIEAAS